MNIFKKKIKGDLEDDWKPTGSFVRKPVKGWIHPDHQLESSGVVYHTRFVGAVKILQSVRFSPLDQRGEIVREAIRRCSHASDLFNFKKKKSNANNEIIGEIYLSHSGESSTTTFSKVAIKTTALSTGHTICGHEIEKISFASIGENEYKNLVGYVSKDSKYERACFVFECDAGLAEDIILTIGQAFELKYKESLNTSHVIQPVVSRFTDSVFDSPRYDENSVSDKQPSVDDVSYSHLFQDVKKSNDSGPGYDTLNRNNNSLINDYDNPSEINFAPGASYGENEFNYATVYDNPIASAAARQHIQASRHTQAGHLNDDYDNPKTNGVSPKEDPYLSPVSSPTQLSPVYREVERTAETSSYSYVTSNDLQKHLWFHGTIPRNDAESLIQKDGEFLVRESASSKGQYVLTGMRDGLHRHLLLVDPQGKVRTRDHSFDSVQELVKFHVNNNRPIYSGSSEVYLLHEVPDLSKPKSATSSFAL
ncbi:SHC-transforming protein 1-like isoform X2 [Hydractinia symbiolongicarpus]|uniref:SHC-transforming protein 1-like isoform X2 n=1 Tax=Hydractinia symbiolongicarpus TaxID=13093 RepID=UPI00254B4A16|nr:SHC-transforming protein 1-like isoform X2 [Hydractinia symbiolongicarpus]